MDELVKSKSGGIINLLHDKGGRLSIPKPFEREIYLFDTHIAGTSYIEGIEDLEPHLKIDDKLDFFREPENQYDDKAMVIKNADGVKIGYLPKADNVILSRLMDAGKLLFARITSKEKVENWLKITIKVFLHD